MRTDNPLLKRLKEGRQTELETCTVSHLDVYSNPYNMRRDIHEFVAYVSQREIKRAHRSNQLPKADSKRLAKLMSHPDCLKDIQEDGSSWWIDEIDSLALHLGFVDYDTEGEYAGYSSHSPSYPNNYIEFHQQPYEKFLNSHLLAQETKLFNTVVNDKIYNEFYGRHLQSRLNGFPSWGSATGVMESFDAPQKRRFLFRLLSRLESGVWYTTKSLIRYLKTNNPYFLIPQRSKLPMESVGWKKPKQRMKRYGNFYEHKKERGYYRDEDPISDDATDGFERVEGRFIERFLEGIPLTLGYVDVAYKKGDYKGKMPERGMVEAFRVNGRFLQFMNDDTLKSKVTVLPNFEIHLESPFYHPGLMRKLQRFAELITEDRVTVLKLEKQRVKAALAADSKLEIAPFLHRLTGRPLPQNIAIELEEWAGQADAFTLYEGFAVLEGNQRLPEAQPFVVEQITPKIRLVRQPEKLLQELIRAERVPLFIKHSDARWTALPIKARTIFPKQKAVKAKPKRKTKNRVVIQRETRLVLHAPTAVFYTKLRDELLKQRCIFEPNQANLSISYNQAYKPQVDAALKLLRQEYTIKFEDKTT
ncbi:MAG: hypothetical protein GY796_07965 [Chloroflexi bacterium]|nr:hypothetical protein [Chloroflexota bacterium]